MKFGIVKHIDTIIPPTPEGKAYADDYEALCMKNGTFVNRNEDREGITISERFLVAVEPEEVEVNWRS